MPDVLSPKSPRSPRVMVPASASTVRLGERLRAFRFEKGMVQAVLAGRLGISPRTLSNLERGVREPSVKELEAFRRAFGLELQEVERGPEPARATGLAGLLLEEQEFFELQQEFLLKRAEHSYDLWFVNPESLPMLESSDVQTTWSENLREGICYHSVWILDLTAPEDLQRFVESAMEVSRSAKSKEAQSQLGQIHVHAIASLVNVREYPATLPTHYEGLRGACNKQGTELLRLHPMVTEVHGDLEALLLRFYFEPAAIVAYKPRRPLLDRPLVAVEFKDVGSFHDRETSGRAYVVLGERSAKEVMRLLREIKRLLETRSTDVG